MASISSETTFKWGVTTGPYHYYRVLSECVPRECPPLADVEECLQGSKYNITVFARNVQEVCQKLTDKGLIFPVKSVIRFDPPARYPDWSAADDKECRQMVDVTDDFNSMVECVTLSVTQDVYIGTDQEITASLEEITSEEYTAVGGVVLGGSAGVTPIYNPSSEFEFSARGGLISGGGSSVVFNYWEYVASGGLVLAGSSIVDEFYIIDSTLTLGLGGHAEAIILGTEDLDIKGQDSSSVTATAYYASITADELESADEDFVTTLCCPTSRTPLTMYIIHNLNTAQNLAQFLRYNDLTMPDYTKVTYKTSDEIWQGSHYYRGQSIANDGAVVWTINLEFGCINPSFGLTDLVTTAEYWKFGLLATMRNITTGLFARSRLLLFFHKDMVCQATFPNNSFNIRFNTSTSLCQPTTVLTPVFYDGTGLFKSQYWHNHPVFMAKVRGTYVPPQAYVAYPELKMPIQEVRGASPSGIS